METIALGFEENRPESQKPHVSLRRGDAVQLMSQVEGNTVDLILTDPPYNLGLFMKNRQTNLARMRENYFGAAGWDHLEQPEWEESMRTFFRQAERLLKPGGALVIFMSVIRIETLVAIAEEEGFYYKTTGVWHKTNPMPRNMNLHFVNSNECWAYFTYKSRTGKFNNNGVELDYIESSVTPAKEKKHGKHPTQKPVRIMRHFVSLLTDPGDTVMDPFMGSGSTGVAAILERRSFLGFDLEANYVEIAKKRIEELD